MAVGRWPEKLLGLVLLTVLGTPTANAAGPDYKREEDPTIDAVEDARGLLGKGFGEPIRLRSLFPPIKGQMRDLSPFWRDAQVQIKPRWPMTSPPSG